MKIRLKSKLKKKTIIEVFWHNILLIADDNYKGLLLIVWNDEIMHFLSLRLTFTIKFSCTRYYFSEYIIGMWISVRLQIPVIEEKAW